MTTVRHPIRFLGIAKLIGALCCMMFLSAPATAACSPASPMRSKLETLKQNKWLLPDEATRQTLALDLLDCLGAPDPVLRDELVFEALSAWMRGKQLTPDTLRTINSKLQAVLSDGTDDLAGAPNQTGFLHPFAALALAEVARVDRVKAFLTGTELDSLVSTSTKYLTNVRDYRGFTEGEGWRHGVAHGADLMLQLALNPRLTKPNLDRILAAVASQIAPQGEHFYRYREGERLMAPVFYIARRELYHEVDWSAWIGSLMPQTDAAGVQSQTTLARRHNLGGFLLPLYFSLRESGDAGQRERLLPSVTKALKGLG